MTNELRGLSSQTLSRANGRSVGTDFSDMTQARDALWSKLESKLAEKKTLPCEGEVPQGLTKKGWIRFLASGFGFRSLR